MCEKGLATHLPNVYMVGVPQRAGFHGEDKVDLFEKVIESAQAETPSYRQAPVGPYLCVVREAKEVKAQSGNKGIELTFTLLEALDSEADMEGVDLSKARLKDTLWVTEKNLPYVQEKISRLSPEAVGQTFRDALDILPGSEVVLTIGHITEDKDGKPIRTPWLKVDRYYSRDWYYQNKLAA